MSETMCEEKTMARSPSAESVHELFEKLPARHRIEAGHGLVENQQVRPVAERQQDRQFLPLAHRHAS